MARVSYLLIQTFKEKQNDQKRLSGTFQVLDGNILMLVHPSSGDNIFYKVREDKSVILLDSFGNGPNGKKSKCYILKYQSGIACYCCQRCAQFMGDSMYRLLP